MEFQDLPIAAHLVIGLYCAIFFALAVIGAHRFWLVQRYFKYQRNQPREQPMPDDPPTVLIQLPIYNERYVAERVIRAIARIEYPRERLTIQVIDDSTDETTDLAARVVEELRSGGVPIEHLRRPDRKGFKAGALEWAMKQSEAELIAIFDADFIPGADFLKRTVGHFADARVGMVQARWAHLNERYSLLTRIQCIMLDGHFVIEHGARNRSGAFFNFNGTAGVWRREAIEDAGGWEHDTLTEDLDLSFRAQLKGWRFIFRPDVTAPSEVPVNMLAFKTQQHRWTKGAMQTARKMLGRIWRAPIGAACKIEATLHLLSNLSYVMMLALALLLWPVYAIRLQYGVHWVFWVDIPMLIAGTGALASFYANAQREMGRSPWRAVAYLPALMALGMGMAVNNAAAAVEGMFSPGGEFVRTPKYSVQVKGELWRQKQYRGRRQILVPVIEAGMFGYMAMTARYCAVNELWWPMPFLALFIAGFGCVSFATARLSGPAGARPAIGPGASKDKTAEGSP